MGFVLNLWPLVGRVSWLILFYCRRQYSNKLKQRAVNENILRKDGFNLHIHNEHNFASKNIKLKIKFGGKFETYNGYVFKVFYEKLARSGSKLETFTLRKTNDKALLFFRIIFPTLKYCYDVNVRVKDVYVFIK